MDTKTIVETPKAGDLRIWWIPQVPMKAFHRSVPTISEAKRLLETLAHYDIFQFENNIKPDYSNMGGLSVFEDDEWMGWEDPETADNIDDITMEQAATFDVKKEKVRPCLT